MTFPNDRLLAVARATGAIAAAWTLSLGVDILLHGALLAHRYIAGSDFLLPPEQAFDRIPFGYAALLGLTTGLWWLLRRLGVRGWSSGVFHGIALGTILWGSLGLGLYSISTAPIALLASWWIGQAIELGLVGGVLGAALAEYPMPRLWLWVIVAVTACCTATVVLQSAGLVPVNPAN